MMSEWLFGRGVAILTPVEPVNNAGYPGGGIGGFSSDSPHCFIREET